MFKIGEFSKLTQVSIRMLRYYDEIGLLKPAFTDRFTSYRLYSTSQIPELQKIILLRHLGFTTQEIKEALPHMETDDFISTLTAKQQQLTKELAILQNRLSNLSIALADIRAHTLPIHYNVAIKSIPSCEILSTRTFIDRYDAEGALWSRFCSTLNDYQISLSLFSDSLSIFYDEDHKEQDVDIEIGFILKKPFSKELVSLLSTLDQSEPAISFSPSPHNPPDIQPKPSSASLTLSYHTIPAINTMACIMVLGPYRHIAEAYHSFAAWLDSNKQYRMSGPSRQICHIGPDDTTNPEEYVTEIQTPISLLTLT